MDSVRASERSPDVLTDIAGDPLCLGCAAINNTNINNTAFSIHRRILQIFWTGAKYAVTDNLDLTGAYYHYNQDSAGADSLPRRRDAMRNHDRPLAIPLRTDELAPAAGSPEQ